MAFILYNSESWRFYIDQSFFLVHNNIMLERAEVRIGIVKVPAGPTPEEVRVCWLGLNFQL